MISVNIVFFGPAEDLARADSASLELAATSTVADLRRELAERYPNLGRALPTIRFAVNEEFATDDTVLKDDDEVALIPPVSGGAGEDGVCVRLVTEPISAAQIRGFITGDPSLGGIVTFEGATRDDVDQSHGHLIALDYKAYRTMALRRLERLAIEAKARWSLGRVAVVHRLGPVPPGEASVVISVAGGHRAQAFDACRSLIDTLKEDVPIWKQELFEDGSYRWVEPLETDGDVEAVRND